MTGVESVRTFGPRIRAQDLGLVDPDLRLGHSDRTKLMVERERPETLDSIRGSGRDPDTDEG